MVQTATTLLQRAPLLLFVTALLLIPALSGATLSYTYDLRHRLTGAVYDNGVTVS